MKPPKAVIETIERAERELEGWCEREKSLALVELILHERPALCVEIGVFGGRSLVPMAAALKHNGSGEIYGVEAWANAAANEHVTDEENTRWWSAVDFGAIKTAFWRFAVEHDLCRHIRIMETTSARAAGAFETIDLLHVDGGHSTYNAAEDVVLYLKKVRPGGIVILDDVNWDSVAPALAIARSVCDPVNELVAVGDGVVHGAVLRKR